VRLLGLILGGMTVSSSLDVTGELIGRVDEIARVDALLDRVRDRGGTLLIRGEPGIGKSAVLDRARGRASSLGARTLATIGVESESELAFAGLHQLLTPIGSRIQRLADPQRQALDAAFGVNDLVEPDPFRVALAVYRLISDAADSSPLLLIADDAQWLDRSSLDVLAFIARRLDNEPVALIAGLRDGFSTALEEAGLPILELNRLSASDSERLLDRVAPGLSAHGRDRVLAQAAGNPLGLVELARAVPDTDDPVELLSRPVESRDRRATVPLPPNHRIAPLPDLPETGNHGQDATSRGPYAGRGPGAQLTESERLVRSTIHHRTASSRLADQAGSGAGRLRKPTRSVSQIRRRFARRYAPGN
jgi:AAA ATPase domain